MFGFRGQRKTSFGWQSPMFRVHGSSHHAYSICIIGFESKGGFGHGKLGGQSGGLQPRRGQKTQAAVSKS